MNQDIAQIIRGTCLSKKKKNTNHPQKKLRSTSQLQRYCHVESVLPPGRCLSFSDCSKTRENICKLPASSRGKPGFCVECLTNANCNVTQLCHEEQCKGEEWTNRFGCSSNISVRSPPDLPDPGCCYTQKECLSIQGKPVCQISGSGPGNCVECVMDLNCGLGEHCSNENVCGEGRKN